MNRKLQKLKTTRIPSVTYSSAVLVSVLTPFDASHFHVPTYLLPCSGSCEISTKTLPGTDLSTLPSFICWSFRYQVYVNFVATSVVARQVKLTGSGQLKGTLCGACVITVGSAVIMKAWLIYHHPLFKKIDIGLTLSSTCTRILIWLVCQ